MTENTFIIRVWCEHSEQKSIQPQFRGVIKHVISGESQYIADTKGLSQFIQAHLPKKIAHSQTNLNQPLHELTKKTDE